MGLEYVLSKGQDQQITELMGEIFNPKEHLGGGDFENLTHEEQFKLYESGSIIPYLSIATVAKINDLLSQVTQANFEANYNANELNKNGIYPCVWHNDNSLNFAYNLRHIMDDLAQLKTIFQQASTDNDYLLVFVG